MHLQRFSESLGIDTGLEELGSAWPPPAKTNADKLTTEDIQGVVTSMLENGTEDIEMIVEFFRPGNYSRRSLVLRQGVSNAQGPDVLKFDAEYETKESKATSLKSLELSLYQAKNWATKKTKSHMQMAARSVGVNATFSDKEPATGSAGYSYQAMLGFCHRVGERLSITPQIVNRVIVFSYEASERSPFDDKGLEGCGVQLWSKEMLEPTISALVVAPDGYEEQDIENEKEVAGSGVGTNS